MGRAIVPEGAVMWLGHYATLLLLVAMAMSVADDAIGQRQGVVEWVTVAALLAWIAAFMADAGRHSEHLCERCIAASPLDPQAAVDKWRRVLRAHHARGVTITLLAVVVTWNFAGGALFRHPPAWALALDATASVILAAVYAVTWQHRRLYPWCPFCRWDEGGAHEVSPDVPSPSVTR